MKLHNYIDRDRVIIRGIFSSLDEISRASVSVMVRLDSSSFDITESELYDVAAQRGQESSICVGLGIALPHARSSKVKKLSIVIGTAAVPVESDATDGIPVELFSCLAIPDNESNLGLKAMSLLVRFFTEYRDKILLCTSCDELSDLIAGADLAMEEPILARDIMAELPYCAQVNYPLRDITLAMSKYRLQSIPVIDENGFLAGEITCRNLFNLGLPDFFKSLKTVSFVRYFDPFEEYFRRESYSTAGDVMEREAVSFSEESTLLEIVFALAVKKVSTIYIHRDQRIVGMIDPETVLHRVINY